MIAGTFPGTNSTNGAHGAEGANDPTSPRNLGGAVRSARSQLGLTQSQLARRAGVTPSYVSRIESASWERGGPWPSDDVLRALARVLNLSSTDLIAQRSAAKERMRASAPRSPWRRPTRQLNYGVSVGDEQVHEAARRLVERNPPRGSLRLTWRLLDGRPPSDELARTLGRMLADDTAAVLYRTCVPRAGELDRLRSTTEQLAAGRDPATIENIRTRCCFAPVATFHALVAEHEALIAVPDRRGRPHLRACVVVDDPDLIAALKDWYDDFIWEPDGGFVDLRYDRLDEAFTQIEERIA